MIRFPADKKRMFVAEESRYEQATAELRNILLEGGDRAREACDLWGALIRIEKCGLHADDVRAMSDKHLRTTVVLARLFIGNLFNQAGLAAEETK